MSLDFGAKEIRNTKPISHELLEELLLELAVKNQERIASCKSMQYIWSSDVAELVFNICEKFSLPNNTKYLALEIYERFIGEHIVETREKHMELVKSQKDSCWRTVEARLSEQSVLRVLTSVQLASKLESHYSHLLPLRVKEILEECGKPFSLNGIFSSELRMMKTLNYKVNVTTPVMYLEILIYILYVNDPNIDNSLYDLAMKVSDLIYLHRATLYNELYETITGEKIEVASDFSGVFLKVKADYMLLATAIIAATSYMFINDRYEIILEQLHQITRIIKRDIRNFSIVITYFVSNILSE